MANIEDNDYEKSLRIEEIKQVILQHWMEDYDIVYRSFKILLMQTVFDEWKMFGQNDQILDF
jgi:hypothetical protein